MTIARLRQRVSKVSNKLVATVPSPPLHQPAPIEEMSLLAAELAGAFARMVSQYQKHYSLSPEEARAQAADLPDHYHERALSCPPDQVSWHELSAIEQRDPARALERWEEVKKGAREEIRNGHRAAHALEGSESDCWGRARFLAIRRELTEGLRPRNAAEQHLVDQMAQYQTQLWIAQKTLAAYTALAFNRSYKKGGARGDYELPRLSDDETVERCMSMVERFQALYLRCLRALQDLRRSPVVVRGARQVNIAQQQVNMCG